MRIRRQNLWNRRNPREKKSLVVSEIPFSRCKDTDSVANLQGIGDKVSVVRFGSLCVFAEFALLDKFSGCQVDFAI